MRVVVSGGGTGGHVYPALSVVEALERPPFSIAHRNVWYLGARGGAEEALALRAGLAFSSVTSGAVRGRGPSELLQSGFFIARGITQAWFSLKRFRPQVILATGGYVSVPVVLAGWLRRVPTLLYLPDVEPGLAVKFLARFASKIAVTASSSTATLPPSKLVVTGYPVRPGFGQVDKAAAGQSLGLDPDVKTLLVWGGSQGARSLNQAIAARLDVLLELCQIIHVCGVADISWVKARCDGLPPALQARYHPYAYLYDGVPEAMAAADLAISRSGASVLGEFPMASLPAVLVPYPHAGAHQTNNARYLEGAGAALLLQEPHLEELVPRTMQLLRDQTQLDAMAQRMKALAQPGAASRIAALLVELATGSPQPVHCQEEVPAR